MKKTHRILWFFESLKPSQLLTFGFLSYVGIGVALLSLPGSQTQPTSLLDSLFTMVSAISTTGLTTVSVADAYTGFGEFVILLLFQLGGLGYMTVTSFIILSRQSGISATRHNVLSTQFSLPQGFWMSQFVRNFFLLRIFAPLCY